MRRDRRPRFLGRGVQSPPLSPCRFHLVLAGEELWGHPLFGTTLVLWAALFALPFVLLMSDTYGKLPLAWLVQRKSTSGCRCNWVRSTLKPRRYAMSVVTANPPLWFHDRPLGRLTVNKYEAMVAAGLLTKHDRLELIEGALVDKMGEQRETRHRVGEHGIGGRPHSAHGLAPSSMTGYPVRIPNRDSRPARCLGGSRHSQVGPVPTPSRSR